MDGCKAIRLTMGAMRRLLVVFEGQTQGFPMKPDSGFVAVRLGENLKQQLGRSFTTWQSNSMGGILKTKRNTKYIHTYASKYAYTLNYI